MLKKSLHLSIVVLLTAVLFIFAGCEGPVGPAGQDAANGDINFPDSITVSVPGTVPNLPEGVSYPPQGAKILSGNAADISKAFNGGIFVANTPDSGTLPTGATGGETYGQDGVDAVVWMGIADSTSVQGSIVVPPGKTLFIAAPLDLNSGNGTFQGITLSDAGTYGPPAPVNPSIQAAVNGGTTLGENSRGRIVILNGGSVTGIGAVPITVGGYLEIHRGGNLSVGAGTFTATPGSEIVNYGQIAGGSTLLKLNGSLVVKGGGSVTGSAGTTGDEFKGEITVESYGEFALGALTGSSTTDFEGPVEVQANAKFALAPGTVNNTTVIFHDIAAIAGTLDLGNSGTTVVVRETGHLDIAATGKLEADNWAQIKGQTGSAGTLEAGNDKTLFAAIAANASPNKDNNYTTIKVPADGLITLAFSNPLTASTYENLRILAESEVLDLPGGVSLTYVSGRDAETRFTIAEQNLWVRTNNVVLDHVEIGNVTVDAGKELNLTGNVIRAGALTVEGGLSAAAATFSSRMDSLTIGPEDGLKPVEITLDVATFGGPTSDPDSSFVITVHEGSKLTLGDSASSSNPVVNPQGSIDLRAGAELYIDSTASGVLAQLEELKIAEGAKFSIESTGTPTFAQLQKLTVDGLLDVNGGSIAFTNLQADNTERPTDVSGDGTAIFAGWTVNGTSVNRAFEQLLAIRHLTVGAVSNIPATSKTDTPDAGEPPAGPYAAEKDRPTLTVASIAAPAGGLTINRDLIVIDGGALNFGADSNTIALAEGYKVKVIDVVRSTLTATEVLNGGIGGATLADDATNGGAVAALTADYATASFTIGTDSLCILAASALNVPGTLITDASGSGFSIKAGEGANEIDIPGTGSAASSLKNGSITAGEKTGTDAPATILVNRNGVLTVAASAAGVVKKGSAIGVEKGGIIDSSNATGLTFGTSGLVAVGKLTGGDAKALITADLVTDGNATITGDLVAMDGAQALEINTAGTLTLTITGSVSTRNLGTAYDSVKLANVVIDGNGTATFNATMNAPVITIGNGGTMTGGTTGTFATSMGGELVIGAGVTLKGSGSLNGVTLEGASGGASVYGSQFTVGENTTLAIAGGGATALTVGSASAAGTLAVVNGGKITLAGANSSIVLLKDTASQKGTFNLGTGGAGRLLAGLTTATAQTDLVGYGVEGTAGAYTSENMTIAGFTNGAGPAGTSATVAVDTSPGTAGQVTITGNASGNTLTANSGIYRIN
jgi:hypothetical protein